ncbi:MAG: OmpA family protein [Saprospiraceae bacterium]|nr:OmpA family protein [Saprospiraceae bacterium]
MYGLSIAQETPKAIVENYQKLDQREAVRAIFIDKQNYKWLGTDKGLYRVISMGDDPELIIKDSITAITEDKNEILWFGNRKQTITTEDKSQSIVLNNNLLQITCMTYYKGDIWVGTSNGLFRVSDDQKKIIGSFTKDNSKLKSNNINVMHVDNENKLWIGTDEGVVIIDGKSWNSYERDHKITGVISTSEGIWLLADKKMWLIYKEDGRDRWQDAAVKRGISKGPVRALVADSKGNVFIASEILVQFNPYTDHSVIIDKDYGFVSSQTLSLACDKNDDLWVGTADRGMFRIDMLDSEVKDLTAVAFAKGEIKCNGAKTSSIRVIVNGGKTPYSYNWNKPEMNGASKDSLGAGDYTVTITDAEAIEFIASVTIKEPEAVQMDLISKERVSDISKKDGKASIKLSGGNPPLRIVWDNGRTGQTVNNLSAGKHILRVYDANNCQSNFDVIIDAPKVIPDLEKEKIAVGQTLRINQLYFTADSSVVSPESYSVLNEIFDFLVANKGVTIEIGGHTNGIPSHEYCDKLSASRAKNIAEYLYTKGIPLSQISFKGYGKRNPIASNETQSGRIKNQRVEMKIVEIKEN